ncbi:hypothetical protein LTR85_000593 [Meristemomyces frigidus]|nr:hypothetical protein LTR85_000593 [Meristemomyces frigidus]
MTLKASYGIVRREDSSNADQARQMQATHGLAIAEKDEEISRIKAGEETMRSLATRQIADNHSLTLKNKQDSTQNFFLRGDIVALERERCKMMAEYDEDIEHQKKSAEASQVLNNISVLTASAPTAKKPIFAFGQTSATADELLKRLEMAQAESKRAQGCNEALEKDKTLLTSQVASLQMHVNGKNTAEEMNRGVLKEQQKRVDQLEAAANKGKAAYKNVAVQTSGEDGTTEAGVGHRGDTKASEDDEMQRLQHVNRKASLMLQKLVIRIEELQNIQLPPWSFLLDKKFLEQMQRGVDLAASHELPYGEYGGITEVQHKNRKSRAKQQGYCADCYNARYPTNFAGRY